MIMVFSKHLYMVILSYILLIIAVMELYHMSLHTALILGCLFLDYFTFIKKLW